MSPSIIKIEDCEKASKIVELLINLTRDYCGSLAELAFQNRKIISVR